MSQQDQSHRFLYYSTTLDSDAPQCALEGQEHHHLRTVLRMRVGDEAFVTNGRGTIARCQIVSIDDDHTTVAVDEILKSSPASLQVPAAVAILRKEAFELVVRQGVELGVTQFVPVMTSKCHLPEYSPKFHARLSKIALAAMKQSFRSVLPVIQPAKTLPELADTIDGYTAAIVGEADAPPVVPVAGDQVLIVVGPEAGLTEDEVTLLREGGAVPVSAVPGRLRAETAVAALVTTVIAAAAPPAGAV